MVDRNIGGVEPAIGQTQVARDAAALEGPSGTWGIVTIGVGPVRYVFGWGFTDGMGAAFGLDGD